MIPRQFIYQPHLRRAITLWIVLAIAVCIKIAWRGTEHSVYPVFAAASHHWWADQPLYAEYWVTERIDGYRYSPAFAVAFTPLAYLPRQFGAAVWSLFSIGLLVVALHRLACDVLPHGRKALSKANSGVSIESEFGTAPTPLWEGMFLILTLFGSVVGIWSGQTNAVVPALLAFGLVAIVRRRWWTAATCLAIPVFIKLWPMAIVLLLLACWPKRLIGRFSVVCLVLALLPFLTRPPQTVAWQYQEWYLSLVGPLQGRWHGYRDAWTIWEQLGPLFGIYPNWSDATSRHVYMAIQLATALGVLGWCLWQRSRVQTIGHLLTAILAMWAAWQLLFGPGTEQLTYGIIAPLASWAVITSFVEKKARWLTITAWTMLAFLPAGDIERTVLRAFPAARMLLPLGVVLFLAWLIWHERGPAVPPQVARDGEGCLPS